MEATHWWGPHLHGFWFIPLVFMVVMCLLVGLMARRAGGWRCGVGRTGPGHYGWRETGSETPRQILDRRYASGEITKEEYEQVRRDLEGEAVRVAERVRQVPAKGRRTGPLAARAAARLDAPGLSPSRR